VEQLTTLEANFLETEDADRHLSLVIGTLAIIDGPMPERQRLSAMLSERISAVPKQSHRALRLVK
jgi:diacylglycerol O-acyltransferase